MSLKHLSHPTSFRKKKYIFSLFLIYKLNCNLLKKILISSFVFLKVEPVLDTHKIKQTASEALRKECSGKTIITFRKSFVANTGSVKMEVFSI